MARKRVYNSNRFDGGMTDSPRDTSNLTKMAYISHLDIYRDPNRMFVMPGFEKVQGFGSDPDGIKLYDLRAFASSIDSRIITALGVKSDGTGSKLFEINDGTNATTWVGDSSLTGIGAVEGPDNIPLRPFLVQDFSRNLYPVNKSASGFMEVAVNGASAYSTITPASLVTVNNDRYIIEKGFNGTLYVVHPTFSQVRALSDTALTNAKTIGGTPVDIASGDYTIGVAQSVINPNRTSTLIWDAASLLADQNVRVMSTRPAAIGFVEGSWVIATETGLYSGSGNSAIGNGRATVSVYLVQGESVQKYWQTQGFPAALYSENDMFPIKGGYDGTAMFHLRMAKNIAKTEYESGVYAIGRGNISSQIGLVQLLNTQSLGVVETVFNSGRRFYFAHNNDGSVSRLQRFDTGTYNVPATIETLIYGADSPYLKELNGISIVTENLPSGGSVVVSYRTDEDDAWTTMGTSDTTGKQKHNFTKANGTPIGRFQEIQFRIVITGKTAVKNIMVAITDTEDLPF